jgi:hypothetical protein
MLPTTHAEENGLPMPLPELAVFLTRASLPPHIAADSEHISTAMVQANRNRRVRGEKDSIEGFQFRCISAMVKDLNSVLAPKLTARAAGIESARYDFERFLPLQKLKKAGCRTAAFGYFSRIYKNFKERDPVQRDFLGKKVTP